MKVFKSNSLCVRLVGFCIGCLLICASCGEATETLPITFLEAGDVSGRYEASARFLVVSTPERFAALYGQIASITLPRPHTPEINFTNARVLVAFMGEKPTAGYGIWLAESARLRGRTLEVTVLQSTPAQDAILAQVVTNPYFIGVVAREGYAKVTFVDETGTQLANIDTTD